MSEAMIIIKEILVLPYSANGFSVFGNLSKKEKNSQCILAEHTEGYKRNLIP